MRPAMNSRFLRHLLFLVNSLGDDEYWYAVVPVAVNERISTPRFCKLSRVMPSIIFE